jgi:hypothetical protein
MAERLADDVFKVTFIVAPLSQEAVVYEFETRPSDRRVVGGNAAARALLP